LSYASARKGAGREGPRDEQKSAAPPQYAQQSHRHPSTHDAAAPQIFKEFCPEHPPQEGEGEPASTLRGASAKYSLLPSAGDKMARLSLQQIRTGRPVLRLRLE